MHAIAARLPQSIYVRLLQLYFCPAGHMGSHDKKVVSHA